MEMLIYDRGRHGKGEKAEFSEKCIPSANIPSLPFKPGKEKRIAIKVIDHRGNEVMVVREMEVT